MATVTKTFAFASDAEGLTGNGTGQQPIFTGWISGDGSPAGSVGWTQGTKNVTNSAQATGPTDGTNTWESWGVPSGATVNTVRVVSAVRKTAANTKLSSHSHRIRIVGSAGTTIHGATDLLSETLPTATGAWISAGGIATAQNVTATASSATVALQHDYTVTTSGGGGSASVDARVDQVVIEIDYTAGASPISGSGGVGFGFSTAGSGTFEIAAISGSGSVAFGFSTSGAGDYTPAAISGTGGVAFGVSTAGSGTYTPAAITGTGSVTFGFSTAGAGNLGAPAISGSGGVGFGFSTSGAGTYEPAAISGSGGVTFGIATAGSGTHTAPGISGSGGVAFGFATSGAGDYTAPSGDATGTGGVAFGFSTSGTGTYVGDAPVVVDEDRRVRVMNSPPVRVLNEANSLFTLLMEEDDMPTPPLTWIARDKDGRVVDMTADENPDLNISGTLTLSDLPTSDPGVAGQVWNDLGTLKVSAG